MMRSGLGRGAIAALLLILSQLQACAEPAEPIPLATHVDLDSMYGGWYIVATIPNWFEKGMVGAYDVYSRRPDGDIREDFYMRKGGFSAAQKHFVVRDRVLPGTHNASWRVQIFWPVSLPFLVLYTDPQYRYVLFGENDRSLGWVYSRTPTIDDADYRALLDRFQQLGYDSSRFRKVVQFPWQIGQPGFWSDGIQ
jgi:apolipoprotein D and lipocalin family protein